MKSRIRITAPTLLCLFLTLLIPLSGLAQGTLTNVALIPVGLAQHVAAEHVHANNQPYQWRCLNDMVLIDIDGNPNGYAFIFGNADGRFNEPAVLRQHITDRTVAPATRGAATQAVDDNDLFAFDDLATVITGATTESPLILRHFRGAPEFWIEAVKLDASSHAGTPGATRVVMVTPMDFRLVAAQAKAATAAAESSAQAPMPLAASAEALAVHSKKAERISSLRQQAQDRETRTRKRVESMTPEQRQERETARQERNDFLRGQWDSKRTQWEEAKKSTGAQR